MASFAKILQNHFSVSATLLIFLTTATILAVVFYKKKKRTEGILFRQNCYGDYKGNIRNPYAESDLSSTITKSETSTLNKVPE